jgi:hypothetical protein
LATYSVPCTYIRQRPPGHKPKSHQKNSVLLEHMINFLEVGDRTARRFRQFPRRHCDASAWP